MRAEATCADFATEPLSANTRLAIGIIFASLSLGVLTDALLKATPWGLNFLLWTAGLVASVWGLARWLQPERAVPEMRLLIPALGFAAATAWRDSTTLKFLDVMAVLTLLCLAVWHRRGGSLVLGTLTGYLRGFFLFIFESIVGVLGILFKTVRWQQVPTRHWAAQVGPVLVGLLISLPLVIIFGALFAAADQTFNRLALDLLDPQQLIIHALVIGLGSWVACGCLRALLLANRPTTPPVSGQLANISLGPVEIGIVLTCLNLLFLTFILIQIRYFFGGEAQIEITPDLLRSQYYRRGFFELVTVAALLLPLLLAADWLLRGRNRNPFFRLTSASLVAMLFVIMASAFQRMWIYQAEFGLTELRLYTTAFMGWLAVVFIWFLLTVLRGHRERFAFGTVIAGLVSIVLLHVINPDAFIVRVNATRAAEGAQFDIDYATSLSSDAIPALAEAIPTLPATDQKQIRDRLSVWLDDGDWRSWSYSRATALNSLSQFTNP